MNSTISAFEGTRRVATGSVTNVVTTVHGLAAPVGTILFFDHTTGRQLDFDLSGTLAEALARLTPPPAPAGRGRPKLGVISTEVTLLPRHWDWLNAQPARASGTLRRLVEEAMAREATDPRRRLEALGRILWAVAGNEPGFEEASRALYAGDRATLNALAALWSGDLPTVVSQWE